MFKTNQHCSRYEETPIQLDTPIIIPGDNVNQIKVVINLLLMIEVHILIGSTDSLKLNSQVNN